jgi:hypothetical protein
MTETKPLMAPLYGSIMGTNGSSLRSNVLASRTTGRKQDGTAVS